MSEIRMENVGKVFGDDVVAVDDMNLTIDDNELVVFLGPSGSGKSTALRLIGGLEKPTDGRIYIGDEDVTNREPQDRNVSMVFQSFALYPHRTVRGNISFPLEAQKYSNKKIESKVQEAAEILDITELLDRKPAQLSGGQQQRVALGRALVRDPAVFLMDEPLANLDERLRIHMQAEMVRLQRELGTTMIHVTHNQEEAMTMGDRVVIMNEGSIQQVSTGRIAYQKPANRFVAQFLGNPSMNILEGSIKQNVFVTEDGLIEIPIPESLQNKATQNEVTLGIRPEALELTTGSKIQVTSGTVDVVELLGDMQVVHLSTGDRTVLAKLSAEIEVGEGEEISFETDQTRIHLFDGVASESPRIER